MQQPITPYINLLSETNDISSIQSILHKCLSDPNVFVGFNEVSSLPNIQQTLQGSNIGQSLLRTLDLFSFGVYLDYQKDSSSSSITTNNEEEKEEKFVKLNDAQEMKLKLLTVVSTVQQVLELGGNVATHGNSDDAEMKVVAASNSIRRRNRQRGKHSSINKNNNNANTSSKNNVGIVHYSVLQKALNLDVDLTAASSSTNSTTSDTSKKTNRQLEEILIQCIYSNLLPSGTKLDQKQKCIIIQHSNPLSSSPTSSTGPTSTTSSSSNDTSTPESDVLVLCRDVNLQSLPSMISKLDTFYKRSEQVKQTLQTSLNDLHQGMKEDVEKWKRVESMIQTTKAKIAGDGNNNGGGDSKMDIVESDSMYDSYGGKRHLKRSRGGRSNRLNLGSRV